MEEDLVVLVPSRSRPQNIARLQRAWGETVTRHARLVTYVDDDDPALPDYLALASERFPVQVGPRRRFIGTLNDAARAWATRARVIGSIGDDHVPRTRGWDDIILSAFEKLGTGVVYGDDGFRGELLPTAAFLSSDIIRALGYMSPPDMVHLFCDDFWRDLGRAVDRLRYLPDLKIEHLHPFAEKAEYDDLYLDANNDAAHTADEVAYHAYLSSRFADDVVRVKKLLDEGPSGL